MELNDIDILEYSAGGQKIKDMSSLTFVGWLAGKINGLAVNNDVRELQTAIANPPLVGKLSDESKIRYVRILLRAGATL